MSIRNFCNGRRYFYILCLVLSLTFSASAGLGVSTSISFLGRSADDLRRRFAVLWGSTLSSKLGLSPRFGKSGSATQSRVSRGPGASDGSVSSESFNYRNPSLIELAPIAGLHIPRLRLHGLVWPRLREATRGAAIWHLPKSSLPGENGNVILVADRNGLFRSLAKVQLGDEVRVQNQHGLEFTYRVTAVRLISLRGSDEVASGVSLRPTGGRLTLVSALPLLQGPPTTKAADGRGDLLEQVMVEAALAQKTMPRQRLLL